MKGFKVDGGGDLVFENGEIQYVSGRDLIAQTARQLLGTNQGEWEYDSNEGINFYALLRKNPDMDEAQDNIRLGLLQVDPTFVIKQFESAATGRNLNIHFVAENDSGDVVDLTI